MSIFQRLMTKMFGHSEMRVLMIGLDAAGKTTILYKLKLGEIVTTIPTIGFNVETVTYKDINFTCWDVGGCDKIRPLWRHYYQNTQAIIFVVDSNDRDRLSSEYESNAGDMLHQMLCEDELRDAVVLVYANKQDLPHALTVSQVTEKLGLNKLRHTPWYIVPCVATTGDGLYEGLEWLQLACKDKDKAGARKRVQDEAAKAAKAAKATDKATVADKDKEKEKATETAAAVPAAAPGPDDTKKATTATATTTASPVGVTKQGQVTQEGLAEILEKWLEIEDESDDDFLAKLAACKLDDWGHRTHLRIAWVHLTKYGRQKGMKLIFDAIKHFIANSSRALKTKFHETMTYFWVHMVHYAIETTKNPTADFRGFLFMNPQLANGGMFLDYYTKKLMLLTPEARTEVVLPDVKPLPSLIPAGKAAHPAAAASATAAAEHKAPAPKEDADDASFIKAFEAHSLNRWSHEYYTHVIYVYLSTLGRKKAIDKIFAVFKEQFKGDFHFTTTYFWIQMVDYAWESTKAALEREKDKEAAKAKKPTAATPTPTPAAAPESHVSEQPLPFAEVLRRHPELGNQVLHLDYYTRAQIDDPKSALEMQLPTLKPLPSLLPKSK